MTTEIAIQKILECLEENLFEPHYAWPHNSFEERSYSRWAAIEIANLLMDRPYECPDTIVEEFMLKMMYLENTTDDPKKNRIFGIAYRTAEDILTLF